jgi:putrescine aminotransferase
MYAPILFPFATNSNQNVNIITSYTKFGYVRNNQEFIDTSLGNSGSFMLGFDRTDIIDAVLEKCKIMPFTSGEFFTTNRYILELSNKLSTMTNGFKVFYSLSGSDANEGAIKAAKLYHNSQGNFNKRIVLGILESYHGSTYLTSNIAAGPMISILGDSNMCHQIIRSADGSELLNNIIAKVNELGDKNISCLVIESCSWLGRLTPYDQTFWESLRNLCTAYNIILIIDDIAMCGGKTGKMFSFNIVPDIFTVGKAFSGGYFPLSATLISPIMFDIIKQEFWSHGFTNNFSASGIYSTLEYLNIIEKENIFKNYDSLLFKAKSLFNELVKEGLVASYTNNGLYFNLKFYPVVNYDNIEDYFFKFGLNVGPDNYKWKGLRIIIPLVATDEYFDKLKTGLSNALLSINKR